MGYYLRARSNDEQAGGGTCDNNAAVDEALMARIARMHLTPHDLDAVDAACVNGYKQDTHSSIQELQQQSL